MEIITVKEVAERLKCSQCFVYKHYKTLGGFKIAGIIRFTQENIDNLIGGGNDGLPAPQKMDV
jgi:hypothetical protein